jgi:hypothetical protein
MFDCCNLVDPIEWRTIIFWGWCPKRWFKDPLVTSSSSHALIFGKNDFSNDVKNYKIWLKNTRNFGINPSFVNETYLEPMHGRHSMLLPKKNHEL